MRVRAAPLPGRLFAVWTTPRSLSNNGVVRSAVAVRFNRPSPIVRNSEASPLAVLLPPRSGPPYSSSTVLAENRSLRMTLITR